MCLDIDPSSVIHKHLVKKISNTIESGYEYFGSGEFDSYHYSPIIDESYGNKVNMGLIQDHNLTMLPSFHISLGAPPVDIEPQKIKLFIDDYRNLGLQQIIGSIVLSNIFISEKNNKKSAWIDVQRLTWRIIDRTVETQIVNEDSNLFILNSFNSKIKKENTTGKLPDWHISLANLTGNPRDSIARPEDCIIDTFNN